jgi:NADPH:quinone reductase-like Zn-dependent oxidoreductase
MKAMQIDRFGGPEELYLADIAVPEPGAGQVLIRTAFASVNPADWKARAGLLPHLSAFPFPMTLGMDCSGIVAKVGPGVVAFRPGERVVTLSGMGLGMGGTYAQYCCAPEPRVALLPDGLTLAEGATIPIASASAASSIIDVAKCAPGDTVFLNGGAGSVGIFGIQYLKHIGARVAATCSTRNVAYVRDLGADLVIDYTREDVASALRAWAPAGLDATIDAIGQNSLPRLMPDLHKPGGTLVCITNLFTGPDAFDLEAAARRGVQVVDNVTAAMTEDPTWFQVAAFRQMLSAIASGTIKVPPYMTMPLEEAAAAHETVAAGHVRGKILLWIADL